MREQPGYDTRPHARLPLRFQDMDDHTNGRSFDSQATWVIHVLVLFLTGYLHVGVFVQPDTGRRPVDWCRN